MLRAMVVHFKLRYINCRISRLIARLQTCYQDERLAYDAKVAAGMAPAEAAAESVDLSVHLRELLDDAKRSRWDLRFAIQHLGRVPLA